MFQITQEVIQQLALLPLLVMFALLRTTAYRPRSWVLASALALSWVMDGLKYLLENDAEIIHYGMALQLAVVLVALSGHRIVQVASLLWVAFALWTTSATEPRDFVLPLIGGLLVCVFAWAQEEGLTRLSLFAYFGLGGIAWMLWVLYVTQGTWYGYQATRFVGLGLLTAAVVVQARRPQVRLV